MKKLILAVLLVAAPLSALADSSKRDSVRELLELIDADAMIETVYAQMDQIFAGMSQRLGVKASEQDIFDEYMNKIVTAMKEEMSWEKMEEPMIDIYLDNYTEKEIQDLLAFYRSDTGRSLIEKTPKVVTESVTVSQKLMEGFMPRLREFAAEMTEELKARRNPQ